MSTVIYCSAARAEAEVAMCYNRREIEQSAKVLRDVWMRMGFGVMRRRRLRSPPLPAEISRLVENLGTEQGEREMSERKTCMQ